MPLSQTRRNVTSVIGFNLITAAEATARLGYANRSSLTRLVQKGKLTPAFKGSGEHGEQFFNAADIDRIVAERGHTT